MADPVARAENEPDALEELARQVRGAATASPRPAAASAPVGAERAPLGAAAAGVSVTGSAPNILSKQARHRLVIDSQRAAWFLLISAVVITVGVLAVSMGDDEQVSGWWVVAVTALAVSGVTLWLVSYLTVMGFGNVSLSMDTSGKDEGGS